MNVINFNLERDRYKDFLKSAKNESIQLAIKHQKQILNMQLNIILKDYKLMQALPNIENSSLEDIFSFSQKSQKLIRGVPQINSKLILIQFIRQSFLELQRSKVSQTYRDITLGERKFKSIQKQIRNTKKQKKNDYYQQFRDNYNIKEKENNKRKIFKKNKQLFNFSSKNQTLILILPQVVENHHKFVCLGINYMFLVELVEEDYQMKSGGSIQVYTYKQTKEKQEWSSYYSNVQIFITSHSMIVWKQFLVLFEDQVIMIAQMKIRQVYSTIGFFNTISIQLTTLLESVEPRREHKASILFGKMMIITGGLDLSMKLIQKMDRLKLLFEKGIAQHTQCTAYEHKKFRNCLHIWWINFKFKFISFNEDDIVQLNPVGWEKVKYSGVAPDGRYNHTMENVGDYLILIGERSQEKKDYLNYILFFIFKKLIGPQHKDKDCKKKDGVIYFVYMEALLCVLEEQVKIYQIIVFALYLFIISYLLNQS